MAPFRKNPAEFLQQVAHQYGDLVYLRLGPQHVYFVNDPAVIREVLVTRQAGFKKSRMLERARVLLGDGLLTSEGDLHLRQRRLVQPAFHRERMEAYAQVMREQTLRVSERWKDGLHFDVAQEMMRLTLAIVSRALFSSNVDEEADEIGSALAQVFDLFEIILLPFSNLLEKLPLPPVRRFHKARARLDTTIYRLIAERRAGGADRGDLLSMLLSARDEDGSAMTDQQVRDEALTLFLAGHETTAQAVSWAWYLLSQNPEAERRLHEEPRFSEAVFAEALRLYPPAWGIGRRALEDFETGGYVIPAGSIVLMSPYVVHRDARWFADPLRFAPQRWLEQADRPKFSYFPFGGGARVCIGERFALTEGALLLETLSRRWRLELEPGFRVEIQPRITLRPKNGIRMICRDS